MNVNTPVCVHGWPMFDPEPCPDCLRAILTGENNVTAAITEPESEPIPEFLHRDPNTGKVVDSRPDHPQRPVGDSTVPTAAVPARIKIGEPGYVCQQHGCLTDVDVAAMADVRAKRNTRIVVSATRNKAIKTREGEYAPGKTWDQRNGVWR